MAFTRRLEPVPLGPARKPGVVAQLRTFRQVLLEPFAQWLVDRVPAFEQLVVDLLGELDRVAAVAQHRCPLRQHGRLGGGAGEAGEPGHALGIAGQILAAMLVGPHQHESVDAALAQQGA